MPPRKSEVRSSAFDIRHPEFPIKHQVVFAPAGSGKTERLSNRYIELLESGVKPERILTLTFTEKAAAEMKQRIFDRLSKKNPALFDSLRNNALKVRISTIHSFCLSLVKRFGPLAGMDPRLDVLADPETTWQAAKYDTLMRVAENERGTPTYDTLMELVTRDQVQGWSRLSSLFDSFFARRIAIARARPVAIDQDRLAALGRALAADPCGSQLPDYRHLFPKEWDAATRRNVAELLDRHADIYLTKGGDPRRRGCDETVQEWNARLAEYRMLVRTGVWCDEFSRSFALFRKPFLEAYTRAKAESGQVDYDDMESLALKLIAENPEWQSILYAFDENTDHLLVDEFQDTSFIQWSIVDKLTEEWRSGEGAKHDRAIEPTVFIVGDDKQSIYMFRDAKVEVFTTAADRLEEWVGKDKLDRITLHDNYRSLQSVIDFTNALFSGLMAVPSSDVQREASSVERLASDAWRTRYSPFERARKNDAPGRVELLLDRFEGKAAECRARDAANITGRIRSLVTEPFTVYERDEKPRPCAYGDIAILIRSRTHLAAIEQALLDSGTPYLVLGGTGFYSEPEVEYLRSLLSFLCDPTDDVALYVTLRGPFFYVKERDLFLANSFAPSESPLGIRHSSFDIFLWDRIKSCPIPALEEPVAALCRWLALVQRLPLARIIEQAMAERKAWEVFWEPQREANCRKFITVIENLEAGGNHPLRILRELEQAGADEPKADVSAEGRNAVQVLTIHAAKGLQFPVVFVPGLDEKLRAARGAGDPLVIEETHADEVLFSYIPEAAARRESKFHTTHQQKELEEEKRVFYVACTRARDALILSGIWNDKAHDGTRLGWLAEHLGLAANPDGFALTPPLPNVVCTDAATLPAPASTPSSSTPKSPIANRKSAIGNRLTPPPSLVAVTRNLPTDFRRHSDDLVGLGDIIHKLLEQISNGELAADSPQLTAEITRLLRLSGLSPSSSATLHSAISNLHSDIPAWSVISPQPDSFAELPIMYAGGKTTFTGRIDRLILTPTEARIYDYKTFPVKPADIPKLVKEYHEGQLQHYADAIRRLYPGRKVSTFLIFTALPAIVPTP